MTLEEYFAQAVGRQAELSRQIGAHAPDLSRWARGERHVPIERCVDIEMATERAVRRWDLRPEDWHRIWPELVGAEGAPSAPPAPEEAARAA